MSTTTLICAANATLKGRDLNHIYDLAKTQNDPEHFAMFKKKEPVDSMAKSLLKHRIQVFRNNHLVHYWTKLTPSIPEGSYLASSVGAEWVGGFKGAPPS